VLALIAAVMAFGLRSASAPQTAAIGVPAEAK
jgi:hypothetical protein